MATNTQVLEERHKSLSNLMRYVISGVLFTLLGLGGLYVYGAERYASKEEVAGVKRAIHDLQREMRATRLELKSDMQIGFDRIDKRAKP